MHIKRIVIAALASAMIVTATAPAFAETGTMELEQKNPVQKEQVISMTHSGFGEAEKQSEQKEEVTESDKPKQARAVKQRDVIPIVKEYETEDYKLIITNKSKQQLSIRIEGKNPKINWYNAFIDKYTTGEETEYVTGMLLQGSTASGTFDTFLAPGETYQLYISKYNRSDEGKYKFYGGDKYDVTMDNSLCAKIQTASEAKKAIVNAANSHKGSVVITVPNTKYNRSDAFITGALNSGPWSVYNQRNVWWHYVKESGFFMYKGKEYCCQKIDLQYSISKSKDAALRKKYKAIVKKAKGSSKARAKYFNSYLVKNCSYKVTNKPTAYEFLVSQKKGQCAHYAEAFATLCRLSGIPCEYVTGKLPEGLHAWNLVKIGKKWYWFDSCWADDGKKVDKGWCFRGSSDKWFTKRRKLDSEYRTKAWKKVHPISKKSLKY